jgi:hypothetical protein
MPAPPSYVLPASSKAASGPASRADDLDNTYDAVRVLHMLAAGSHGVIGGSDSDNVAAVAAAIEAQQAGTAPVWLLPSGDTTGVTDLANIQGLANMGVAVNLGPGVFWTDGPIVTPLSGRLILHGVKGATQSGSGAGQNIGSVIKPSATWSAAGLPVTGVITAINGNGTGNTAIEEALDIRDLWIDGTSGPAGVDGISSWGAMHGLQVGNVGIYKATGTGINVVRNANFSSANFTLGTYVSDVLIQSSAGWGAILSGTDGTWTNVHTQECLSGGIQVTGGHNQFIGCRPDLSGFVAGVPQGNQAPGWKIDQPGGGGFLDATMILGGSTQRNDGPGLLITNSSANGTALRSPVVVTGTTFDGDWVNGGAGAAGQGAIQVQGRNEVFLSNVCTFVHTEDVPGGCPDYGLSTQAIGSTPGSPISVIWQSGYINAIVGDILDSAGIGNSLRVGPNVTETIGSQLSNSVSQQFLAVQSVARLLFGAAGATDITLQRTATGKLQLISTASASPQLQILASFSNTTQALLQMINNAAGDLAFSAQVNGDSNSRYRVDSNGQTKWGSGAASQDCVLDRQAANVMEFTGCDLDIATAGRGLRIKEGANAKAGVTTLASGRVTVSTTAVTANSRIILSSQTANSTAPGQLRVSSKTAGKSFVIRSTSATDGSDVYWLIIEPG